MLKRQGRDPRKESRVDGCFVMGGEKAIASDAAHSVPRKDMLLNQGDLNQLGLEKKFVLLSGKQGYYSGIYGLPVPCTPFKI